MFYLQFIGVSAWAAVLRVECRISNCLGTLGSTHPKLAELAQTSPLLSRFFYNIIPWMGVNGRQEA